MASSVSWQDESNPAQDGAILPARDYRLVPQEKCPRKLDDKSFTDQACSVKMAGYRPRFFCVFMDLDSVSVINTQKKNSANIQPS